MNPWTLVGTVGRASVEGGLLILAVWAVCRWWRSIPAWTRSGLWWLASARMLVALLPLAHVTVHAPMPVTAVWWPAALASGPARPGALSTPPGTPSARRLPSDAASTTSSWTKTEEPARPANPGRWIPIVLVGVWATGLALRASGLARHGRRVRQAVRSARPMPEGLAGVLGVGAGVRLAVSSQAPVPLVTGLLRPTVLLPVSMLGRSERDLRLALFHELAHVRRGDLWLAWVPALAEAAFWFHPLVLHGVREYVLACEEACDVEALRATGAHPHDYGRLLLAFGVHGRLAGATAMPCGSPSGRQLIRRLSMLKPFVPSRPGVRSAAVGLLCAFALVGLVPLRVVPTAAAPGPSPLVLSDAVDPPAVLPVATERSVPGVADRDDSPRTPDAEPDDSELPDDLEADDAPAGVPAVPPTPPAPPAPRASRTRGQAVAPPPAYAPAPGVGYSSRAPRARRSGVSWGYDDSEREPFAYVLARLDGGSFTGSGSGNVADWQEVKRLEKKLGHDFLWVRVGDDRYLIEDEDLLQQADEVFRPQREIGERQTEIGAQQTRIGDRQTEIGSQQSRIGQRQSEIAERQAELARRMAERDLRRSEERELDRQLEELNRQMEDLGREQERLGRRMEPLGEQQQELGARMEELSQDMARMARTSNRRIRALVDEAIQSGAARPLR